MFHDMNVNLVHLGEFHGDGHQKDPGPLRLPELAAMFDECRRWSDERLLVIPGEEVNEFSRPGAARQTSRPLDEPLSASGLLDDAAVRRAAVRRGASAVRQGLPRRRAGRHDPPVARRARTGMGGPSANQGLELDARHLPRGRFLHRRLLARRRVEGDARRSLAPKQGERVLDLLDDMANWGHKKYVLGEVDVFKIDHTHELYAHMNVNYVRLDRCRDMTKAGSRC
jgi:hypothetical protein